MDEVGIRVVPKPWNKGKLVGQKAPLKLKEIWAIRVRLQVYRRARELALFDLGIDSKLRACDLLKLKVRDVSHGERIAARAIVVQQKTSRPVQFEIGVDADHVVFGHVHRLGPLAADDPDDWHGRERRPKIANTGSWLYEPLLVHHAQPPHPYWPGGAIVIDDGAEPRAVGLLDDLPASALH